MKRFVFDWTKFRLAVTVHINLAGYGATVDLLLDTGISGSSWHRFMFEHGTLSLDAALTIRRQDV